MNTQEIKNAYQAIAEHYDWMAELTIEKLSIQTEKLSQQTVLEKLQVFQPKTGWLQTIDAVTLIEGSTPNLSEEDWIESGELINANGDTIHIRPAGQNKLHWVKMRSDGNDEYFVTHSSHQIKHRKKQGIATYKLYWDSNDHNRTQAKFSRSVKLDIQENK
jgi:hypothetical protein